VDSAVAAYLLKEAGHELFALFMHNWEEEGRECPSTQDREDVAMICDHLQIPHYTLNLAQEYRHRVFSPFLEGLSAGHTPNPDILCNREIKFDALYEKARVLGAEALATGHYCQVKGGRLMKGRDPHKDQSYFLSAMPREVLPHILFPIGHMQKKEVRTLAHRIGLPVHNKRDSTGICFIGKRDFRPFMMQYLKTKWGDIETEEGEIVGRHPGAHYFTIGQRKGLDINRKQGPWFVTSKEMNRNVVIVTRTLPRAEGLIGDQLSWLVSTPDLPLECHAKVRYRQADIPCQVMQEGEDRFRMHFDLPQQAVTPHQAVVFYRGDLCLGGGRILEPIFYH
ncbi:MAG: tRNA 2-thiouridine(34) synthase MnmA, partial [Chlamydiota bacterium]|nr:tRNA 2-thiouridine(34) synthase MnmA [Chlamydiota bacterium]